MSEDENHILIHLKCNGDLLDGALKFYLFIIWLQ